MSRSEQKSAHHHGDLRNALIQAGLEILDREGLHALTLRKAAARAGVTHSAPAHHFHGKEGLLEAIATHGFEQFTALMNEERSKSGSGARDQLEGIIQGYLRFSREHPALFQLIFTLQHDENTDPELEEASLQAYLVLADVCALFKPSAEGPGVNEMRVWSFIHGYASLTMFGRGMSPTTGDPIPFELLIPDLEPLD